MKNPTLFTLFRIYCISEFDEDGNMEIYVKKRR